ncbi:hypothetical protein [Alkalihalobacterium alkalinitrilicum]|uniref:hypothetical protein n=1 Tax=Alkalihalobacterium alkalinitrilicum TaxID=427920 RepID=UPI001302F93D|nr:hypothetical protein [Alkalihalobacterium alkalinitrilicum]
MWLTVKEKQYLANLLVKQKRKVFISKEENELINTIYQKLGQTTNNQTINKIRKPKL